MWEPLLGCLLDLLLASAFIQARATHLDRRHPED